MKKGTEDFEFFDDCPICQTMKKAEKEGKSLSKEELEKAFEKAREKGGIVGTSIGELPKVQS